MIKYDLKIPVELHEYFKNYPSCPEQRVLSSDELSQLQQSLLSKNNLRLAKSKKLLLTLYDKTDYVIHYRLLKKFLSLGIVETKIKQVGLLSLDQSPRLRLYIETYNELRRLA